MENNKFIKHIPYVFSLVTGKRVNNQNKQNTEFHHISNVWMNSKRWFSSFFRPINIYRPQFSLLRTRKKNKLYYEPIKEKEREKVETKDSRNKLKIKISYERSNIVTILYAFDLEGQVHSTKNCFFVIKKVYSYIS